MNATPYFESTLRQVSLVREAKSWLETPFVPHARIRGAGVDCVHLCAEIYKECGLLSEFNPPPYTIDGGHHCKESKVIAHVLASGKFQEVIGPTTQGGLAHASGPGDLLCFRMDGVVHHVGILLTRTHFIHAIRGHGVVIGDLQDTTWSGRLEKVFRPIEGAR